MLRFSGKKLCLLSYDLQFFHKIVKLSVGVAILVEKLILVPLVCPVSVAKNNVGFDKRQAMTTLDAFRGIRMWCFVCNAASNY